MKQDTNTLYGLVEKSIEGDKKAFEELYKMKAKSILFQSTQKMGNVHDGEELAQSVVISMYQNIHSLRKVESINAWISSIVTNSGNRMLRKRYRNNEELDIEDYSSELVEEDKEFLPSEYAESNEVKQVIMQVVEKLPDRRKSAIILYYYEDMSYKEIADAMGISIGAVSNAITKGRETIKGKLEKEASKMTEKAQSVLAVPVLTQVLREQANTMFTPDKVEAFVYSCTNALDAAPAMGVGKETVKIATKAVANTSLAAKVTMIITSVSLTFSCNRHRRCSLQKHRPQHTGPQRASY